MINLIEKIEESQSIVMVTSSKPIVKSKEIENNVDSLKKLLFSFSSDSSLKYNIRIKVRK